MDNGTSGGSLGTQALPPGLVDAISDLQRSQRMLSACEAATRDLVACYQAIKDGVPKAELIEHSSSVEPDEAGFGQSSPDDGEWFQIRGAWRPACRTLLQGGVIDGLDGAPAVRSAIGSALAACDWRDSTASFSERRQTELRHIEWLLRVLGEFAGRLQGTAAHRAPSEQPAEADLPGKPAATTIPGSAKKRFSKDEANVATREYLTRHASGRRVSKRELAKIIGCSEGLISKLPCWITYQEGLRKLKPAALRAVRLTDETSSGLGRNDAELQRLIGEQAEDAAADRHGRRRRPVL